MHRGTIAEAGDAGKFFTMPATEEARAFLEGRLWAPAGERTAAN